MEKFKQGDMVAVLVSRGHGAGWSTWNHQHKEQMMYDPEIVQLCLDGVGDVAIQEVALSKWPDAYFGGVDGLSIEWISEDTEFIIDEYDGHESVVYKNHTPWMKA
jgi:hypothetical protein